jgi:hypothetical protein
MKLKEVDFKILEYLAFWEGGVTAGRIAEVVGVDRVHAQRAIMTPYKSTHPGQLEPAGRSRRLADQVIPLFGPRTLTELFETVDMVRSACGEGRVGVPTERLDGLARRSGEGAFRTLYAACARKEAVGVTLEGPDGAETGLFSPHHLIRDGGSPFFRGHLWSTGAGRYLDLDPNRVSRAEAGDGAGYVGPDGDADWHARETVTLQLAEGLSPELRAAALREHPEAAGQEKGRLVIRGVRRCLVPHLVRQMRYRVLEEGPVEVWVPDTCHEIGCEKHFEKRRET